MDPAPTIPREMTTHRPNLRVATPLEGLVSKPAVEDLPRTWQARTLKEEAQPMRAQTGAHESSGLHDHLCDCVVPCPDRSPLVTLSAECAVARPRVPKLKSVQKMLAAQKTDRGSAVR